MIRSELVQKIADENPHLTQRHVERIVNTVFEQITDAMAKRERVELRGFGSFSVKQRDARLGRNPRTGEAVSVDSKCVPFFKTGKTEKTVLFLTFNYFLKTKNRYLILFYSKIRNN